MQIAQTNPDLLYNTLVKRYRNKLRKYEYNSLIKTISNFLLLENLNISEPAFPWVVERFLIWALDDDFRLYKDKKINDHEIKRLAQMCFHDMDRIYESTNIQNTDIHLFVRQFIVPQFEYQRNIDLFSFARQIYILIELPSNSKIITKLNNDIGSNVIEYLKQCFYIYLYAENKISLESSLNKLSKYYGDQAINRFISHFSATLKTVKSSLKNDRIVNFDEWHRPNLLRKFPCIYFNSSYLLTGKATLRRYCEYFIDDKIDVCEGSIRKKWEDSLCNYTHEILKSINVDVINEDKIRNKYSIIGEICDLCVLTKNFVILMEVKRKNFSDNMPVMANEKAIKSKLKATILKAIGQLQNVFNHIIKSEDSKNRKIINLITTSSQLWFGDTNFLLEDKNSDLPNLYIMTIGEIDRLCTLVADKKCTLDDFFEDLLHVNSDPETKIYSPELLFKNQKYSSFNLPRRLKSVLL